MLCTASRRSSVQVISANKTRMYCAHAGLRLLVQIASGKFLALQQQSAACSSSLPADAAMNVRFRFACKVSVSYQGYSFTLHCTVS